MNHSGMGEYANVVGGAVKLRWGRNRHLGSSFSLSFGTRWFNLYLGRKARQLGGGP